MHFGFNCLLKESVGHISLLGKLSVYLISEQPGLAIYLKYK